MGWVSSAALAFALAQQPAIEAQATQPTPPAAEAGAPPESPASPSDAVKRDPVSATADTAAAVAGVTPYPADYFTQYRPNTALDMISRLPGFQFEIGDEDVRGLAGSAGNVLIDGARPASKSDSIESQLNRIPASQVARIEVIQGGAPGIDMQGRSLVANVVRTGADSLQQIVTGRLEQFTEDGRLLPGWRYELNRQAGPRTLELSLGRFIGYDDSTGRGRRVRRDPAGAIIRDEFVGNEADGFTHQGTAAFKTPALGGTLRLNGLLGENKFKPESHFDGTLGRLDVVDADGSVDAEVGANFTRDLGKRFSVELVGLQKIGTGDYRSRSEGYENVLFTSDSETAESVGRVTLKHRRSDRLSFEAGGELAFNLLEGAATLTVDGDVIDLPSADVRVEENRGEVFGLANWRPLSTLTLEGGARFEESTIRQIGDNARERSFRYLKPRALATWSPDPRTTVRARVERELGQLDFGDFVSSANLTTGVVAAGNPELEPDKTWVYELTGERRFWDTGALVATVRRLQISDVIDRIPVTETADDGSSSTFEAPGNIGKGTQNELEVDLTLPLKRFGVAGGEFKFEGLWRDSEVTDPTTGEKRRISGQRPDVIEATYRHDLPSKNLVFRLVYFDGWKETYYNFDQVTRFDLSEFVEATAEYTPRPRTFLSLALSNASSFDFKRLREVYAGRRDDNPLAFTEARENRSQVRLIFRVRQTFGT